MKTTYKYIIALSALICACTYSAQAQSTGRVENDGVTTSKTVSGPDEDGIYTLTLETWVTGTTITTTEEVRLPVDVVLVLDASGSMDDDFGSTTGYRAYNQNYSYNTVTGTNASNTYYYLRNGEYYKVNRTSFTGKTPRSSQAYTYNGYGTNTYYFLHSGEYCQVTRNQRAEERYTARSSQSYPAGSYSGEHYVLYNGQYYLLTYNRESYLIVSYRARLQFVANGTTYYLHSDGSINTNKPSYGPGDNLYNGVLYDKTTNVYSLTFQYGGQTYYLKPDGTYTTTRAEGEVTSNTENIYNGVLYQDGTVYALTFAVDGTTYYLTQTGPTTIPTGASANNATIYPGTLYRMETGNVSRMQALQAAVADFVESIHQDAVTNNVDNTISVVKFADDSYASSDHLAEGNSKNRSGYNYTQLVKNFTNVKSETGANAVISAVNSIDPDGGTAADYGMDLAGEVLGQNINHIIYSSSDPEYSKTRQSAKVVIMFTDGDPNHGSGFSTSVATLTVKSAKDLKDKGTLIYTIGVFTSPTDQEKQYMNAVSSNYPNAQAYTDGGTGVNDGYFYNSNGDIDLSAIFTSIAEEIQTGGAATTEVTASSLILDVVTDSFQLPAGANTEDIKMYTSKGTVNNTTGDVTWAALVEAPNSIAETAECIKAAVDEETGLTDIIVRGFDFSAHWVGKGAPDPYKFVIKIPIIPKPDAVGGENIETNTEWSGIYFPDEDDPNKPGDPIEDYEVPELDLPVKIQITKSGLEEGESATFIISRRPTSNASASFTYFTTVMLTGVGTGEEDPIVVLKDLDPHYIYQITEGDWSWTYNISNETGETQTTEGVYLNPFTFSNAKKNTDIPQNNAEATVHNVFEKSN